MLVCGSISSGYSPIKSTALESALKLQIGSLSWYQSDNSSSYVQFTFDIDLIVNNTSSENITIVFNDGDKWRVTIEVKPANDSLTIIQSTFYYIMILMECTFEPGITTMTEIVGIDVYDPLISTVPDGEYTITIGEYYSGLYSEIAGSVSKTFYIYNFYYYISSPSETSQYWIGIISGLLLIQIIVVKKLRKRKEK